MYNQFNLEKALVGKAVIGKDGSKIYGCKLNGNFIEISFGGEPVKYTLEEAIQYLRMAEEEMYIFITKSELELGKLISDTKIYNQPPLENKFKDDRIFKLVEFHGKD